MSSESSQEQTRVFAVPKDAIKRGGEVETTFRHYVDEVQVLGVVCGLLIGSRTGIRLGYLWNVLGTDFSLELGAVTPFINLNRLSVQLQRDLTNTIPIRVSHANLSQLPQLIQECERRQIETEFIDFR